MIKIFGAKHLVQYFQFLLQIIQAHDYNFLGHKLCILLYLQGMGKIEKLRDLLMLGTKMDCLQLNCKRQVNYWYSWHLVSRVTLNRSYMATWSFLYEDKMLDMLPLFLLGKWRVLHLYGKFNIWPIVLKNVKSIYHVFMWGLKKKSAIVLNYEGIVVSTWHGMFPHQDLKRAYDPYHNFNALNKLHH